MTSILLIMVNFFFSDNQEFFKAAEEDAKNGATWHYVGKQELDPKAKSLTLQVDDGEKYILWKLKK